MPHTSSAKKRLRQNAKRRLRNKALKTEMRHKLRAFRQAIEAGNADAAKTILVEATSLLDRAGKTNVVHHRQADRRKSRMQAALNKLIAGKGAPAGE